MRYNLHTHTARCRHATGTVTDFAAAAMRAGLNLLGMTDHTPLPDGRFAHVRMRLNELDGYVEEIAAAQRRFPTLQILRGLECDWHRDYAGFFKDTLLGTRHLEYLIGAVHWFQHHGRWTGLENVLEAGRLRSYVDHYIEGMGSGLFAFMAHPDIIGLCPLPEAEIRAAAADIAAAAVRLDLPLEINGYGLRKPPVPTPAGRRAPYPLPAFWETAAQYDIAVVCNSDAHQPEDVAAGLTETRALADRFGLRVVTGDMFLARSVSACQAPRK